MKGKLIPEKGNSNCKILTTRMSLVGKIGDVDRIQRMVGFRVKIKRFILFLVPQENLDF